MFQTLRKKLILLFTISTGFILTVVFVAILLVIEQQLEMVGKDNFRTLLQTIANKLQTSDQISYPWVADLENKNNLSLTIFDNKIELKSPITRNLSTDRSILLEQLDELSKAENINIFSRPVSSTILFSSIFTIDGIEHDNYYASAVVFPLNKGFRSFYLLQNLTLQKENIRNQRILFFIFYLIGITSLFFVSRMMVGISLRPVKESHQKQTEFIAAASHELRSPLAVIRANNSAIHSSYHSDFQKINAASLQFSTGIETECSRMARLIEDMLLLASADAKNWTIKTESIDMDCLLLNTYECYLPLCREKSLHLKLELPEEVLPPFLGDQQRLQQILSALLDNALSYSLKNSSLLLRAYSKKNLLILEVEDHGLGVPDSEKPFLFDRFYRMDKSRKDKQHFGLGLSIVKELVDLHNGVISIIDTEGGGATFRISLPLSPP